VASDFKASRRLILEHARWFNLRNYDRLMSANHDVWFAQFALRIDLHRMRSLFAAPDSETKRMHLDTHAALIEMIRAKGVADGALLKRVLELEEFMYPESFSVLRMTSSDGVYLRPLNLDDVTRIHNGLDDAKSQALTDPIEKHVHRSLIGAHAYITVDLRCPRELLVKQFEELIDGQRKTFGSLLTPAQQTTMPTDKAWIKSKVLPYIDLRNWRDDLHDPELKNRIKDADIAAALEIDPKTLSETTKVHAEILSDPTTWGFIHLLEAAISYRRGPLTPQRLAKKAQRKAPKIKE
jgi:Family of unknown function (DUF6387)